jgi:YidC/Oxa1 family membrane protein insertase
MPETSRPYPRILTILLLVFFGLTAAHASATNAPAPGLIAVPFYLALQWIHLHIVANWGWAILVLTLGINLALLPARIYAMRTQRKLQRLQPRIDAIRARFKDCRFGDPRMQEMNAEILALHRSEGVYPAAGLLPLLVQMPLLFGFYRMLKNAHELQNAPWLWLHDLSASDPLHLLPLAFVVTMVTMQLLTPSPGVAPAQRRIMAFASSNLGGVMSWNVAAALTLYWTFGNVIGIVHQIVAGRSRLG